LNKVTLTHFFTSFMISCVLISMRMDKNFTNQQIELLKQQNEKWNEQTKLLKNQVFVSNSLAIAQIGDRCMWNTLHGGDYDSYLYWRESRENEAAPVKQVDQTVSRGQRRQRKATESEARNLYYRRSAPIRKRIAEIETELVRLEEQIHEIEKGFSEQEHYSDGSQVVETIGEHRRLKEAIGQLTAEWERLSVEAEQLRQEFMEDKR